MHTLLDLHGNIPAFVRVAPATIHEIHMLDPLLIEAGSIYIMDRAYLDFQRLHVLHQALAFFIIRARKDFRFHRLGSQPIDKSSGLRCDQSIRLQSFYTAKSYPEPLRRIRYYDAATEKNLVFLTNNFRLPTFKWIKQHLRIKKFYGLSPNAVKTQLWIAISVYVLLAIVRKRLGVELSLYPMAQILSLSLFEKTPLLQAFSRIHPTTEIEYPCNQMDLFNL